MRSFLNDCFRIDTLLFVVPSMGKLQEKPIEMLLHGNPTEATSRNNKGFFSSICIELHYIALSTTHERVLPRLDYLLDSLISVFKSAVSLQRVKNRIVATL